MQRTNRHPIATPPGLSAGVLACPSKTPGTSHGQESETGKHAQESKTGNLGKRKQFTPMLLLLSLASHPPLIPSCTYAMAPWTANECCSCIPKAVVQPPLIKFLDELHYETRVDSLTSVRLHQLVLSNTLLVRRRSNMPPVCEGADWSATFKIWTPY
jgi:hypothetical protein